MNKAYWKEEIRADSLAIMLMKKFFNADGKFAGVIKEAKKRLDYMVRKFKGKSANWQMDDYYTINWATWDGWNNSKKDWSNLAFAA